MPEVRYVVPGIPPQVSAGLSAFMPHFDRQAAGGAQSYKYGVRGYPGTLGIPSPTSSTQMHPDVGDLAQTGDSRSNDQPDVTFPNLYYERLIAEQPGAGMPILRVEDATTGMRSLIPIPAVDPTDVARSHQAMSPPTGVVQRIRQLPWFPRLYQAPR
jgi:hypothetical protein